MPPYTSDSMPRLAHAAPRGTRMRHCTCPLAHRGVEPTANAAATSALGPVSSTSAGSMTATPSKALQCRVPLTCCAPRAPRVQSVSVVRTVLRGVQRSPEEGSSTHKFTRQQYLLQRMRSGLVLWTRSQQPARMHALRMMIEWSCGDLRPGGGGSVP